MYWLLADNGISSTISQAQTLYALRSMSNQLTNYINVVIISFYPHYGPIRIRLSSICSQAIGGGSIAFHPAAAWKAYFQWIGNIIDCSPFVRSWLVYPSVFPYPARNRLIAVWCLIFTNTSSFFSFPFQTVNACLCVSPSTLTAFIVQTQRWAGSILALSGFANNKQSVINSPYCPISQATLSRVRFCQQPVRFGWCLLSPVT